MSIHIRKTCRKCCNLLLLTVFYLFFIRRFQTYLDDSGQKAIVNDSSVSWINRNLETSTTSSMTRSISEGDFVTLWVRAEDVMGNREVSSLKLGFDSSSPQIFDVSFMRNTGTRHTYGSKWVFLVGKLHLLFLFNKKVTLFDNTYW